MSITPCQFTYVTDKLRTLFHSMGFMEVNTQGRLSTLVACEDPSTMSIFSYGGKVWPLPQSGQYWLQRELLSSSVGGPRGFFCLTTSYRNEHSPAHNRHDGIFPMFEFEVRGGHEELHKIQRSILDEFGFDKYYVDGQYPGGPCKRERASRSHGKADDDISAAKRETHLREQYGPVYFLHDAHLPAPFWNARRSDVVLQGIETINGSTRMCDVHEMRRSFYEMNGGRYSQALFSHFTRERVQKELDNFLSFPMVPRSGGGIGLLRLMRALQCSDLESTVPYPVPTAVDGDVDSDEDENQDPFVCDMASIFEKVVIDRVNSNTDLRKLQITATATPVLIHDD